MGDNQRIRQIQARRTKKAAFSFLHRIEMNHEDVCRHVEPFSGFAGLTVGNLNKAILKKWLIWLAGRKAIRRKKDGTTIEERKNLQNYQRLIIVHVLLLGTVIFSGKEFLVKLILLALAGLAVQ